MPRNEYSVTYAFDGYLRGDYENLILRVTETIAEMQRDGIEIDFLGATQEIDAAGQLTRTTVRYAAPSQGIVGRLNCRARLPASGSPQRRFSEKASDEDADIALAGG